MIEVRQEQWHHDAQELGLSGLAMEEALFENALYREFEGLSSLQRIPDRDRLHGRFQESKIGRCEVSKGLQSYLRPVNAGLSSCWPRWHSRTGWACPEFCVNGADIKYLRGDLRTRW